MFPMHQKGEIDRQKIRIRSYVDSKLSFLEIKKKNTNGRTKKIRIPISRTHVQSIDELSSEQLFLDEHSLFAPKDLQPALANNFNRITLVNNDLTERVTIDIDLSFHNYLSGQSKALDQVMIIEIKQESEQRSDFQKALRHLKIPQISFSKYYVGTLLTNPQVTDNQFSRRFFFLERLLKN
jgi:hypothetical protein